MEAIEELRDDHLRIGLLALKRLYEANKEKISKDEIMAFDFTFMYITKALHRLEAIENSNPSEALECLDKLTLLTCNIEWYKDNINTIKQALIKAEKEHKALEIIKKKTVDIWLIQNKNLKRYNSMVDESRQLTEEEFNILKEVLE